MYEKIIVNCPKCGFSFFTLGRSCVYCPSCNTTLRRDDEGYWCWIRFRHRIKDEDIRIKEANA